MTWISEDKYYAKKIVETENILKIKNLCETLKFDATVVPVRDKFWELKPSNYGVVGAVGVVGTVGSTGVVGRGPGYEYYDDRETYSDKMLLVNICVPNVRKEIGNYLENFPLPNLISNKMGEFPTKIKFQRKEEIIKINRGIYASPELVQKSKNNPDIDIRLLALDLNSLDFNGRCYPTFQKVYTVNEFYHGTTNLLQLTSENVVDHSPYGVLNITISPCDVAKEWDAITTILETAFYNRAHTNTHTI